MWQLSVMAFLRPGQLLGFLGINNAEVVWRTKSSAILVAASLTRGCQQEDRFIVQGAARCRLRGVAPDLTIWVLTPVLHWVDVVEVYIATVPETGDTVVTVSSQSACVVPAIVPLAPVIGTALAWLPFADHGANLEHIHRLRRALIQDNVSINESIINAGCELRWKGFLLVTVVFLLVLTGSVTNYLYNHHEPSRIAVTTVSTILTVMTFVTYGAAIQRLKMRRRESMLPLLD